jgi:hypothetical protein
LADLLVLRRALVIGPFHNEQQFREAEGEQYLFDRRTRVSLKGVADRRIVIQGGHHHVEDFVLRQASGTGWPKKPMRKTNLARLLARRPDGIFVAPFEQGEIGPELFQAACRMGLEGLVSKHRDRAYRAGRSLNWVKVKNPEHPAISRVKNAFGA